MRPRSLLCLAACAALLATSTAGAQGRPPAGSLPDGAERDALADDDPGFKSKGYKKYYPGMAAVTRGELRARLHARIETRIGLWAQGQQTHDNMFVNGDQIEKLGFGIPRARLGINGQLADHIPFLIATDLANRGGTSDGQYLLDAWVGYQRFHFFKLYLGARTVPFSRSAILSSADAGLSERARSADAMAPFRQVGLTLAGDYELAGLGWRLGVYNGFERHTEFYRGIVNGTGLRGNRFHGLSMVGRLHAEPLGQVGPNVADLERGKLRLHVGGGMYMNDAGTGKTQGMSADLHVKVAGFHLLAEWIRDDAEPVESPTTPATIPEKLTRQAMSVELGYTIAKHGIAVRAEMIDPNTAVDDNRDEMWLSVAFNHHFIENMARFSLQFDHREERNGEPRDNDALYAKLALRF